MTVKYNNPPINELVIGLYFDKNLPIRSEHVGLFWSSVREEFPRIKQQPPLFAPLGVLPLGAMMSELAVGSEEVYPMPRFFLERADGSIVVQLQKNAFLLNWRKREGNYPHYEAVKAAFDKNYARFGSFLNREFRERPNLQIAELTYINAIQSCNYWQGPQDTPNVFPSFQTVKYGATVPDFNQVTMQQIDRDLNLITSIRNARTSPAGADQGAMMLIFEFRALGLLGAADKPEADLWFDRAHDVIGDCFTTITNPDIQRRHWQPEGSDVY